MRRRCMSYLRSEFSKICSSHLLFELDEDMLYECLLSDFVQVCELQMSCDTNFFKAFLNMLAHSISASHECIHLCLIFNSI